MGLESLEKEMNFLPSDQLCMINISESLTRIYDESGMMMDDEEQEEFID
jgi:hypothetical protein